MKKLLTLLLLSLSISFAQLRVATTYPWIGELVKEVGGDRISLYVIAKPTEDFHFVVPKPSHIAKLRNANLLIINGASLEIGFIPPLIQQSNNPEIQPGRPGFLDLSAYIDLIEKPITVSRAMGDVHPEGNPHYHLDPHHIPLLARAIKERMCQLDHKNCGFYNSNLEDFLKRWNQKIKEWDEGFSKLRGLKVIQYHKTYKYFFKRYGIEEVGTFEPLPGIPPTPKHVDQLIKHSKDVRLVIYEAFRDPKLAKRVADSIGARAIVLPHDVGVEGVKNLFDLFDEILKRLSQ
ncbi:MAG: metal ABC transporter solute-binding protein, Zn/Mn family [Aquificaceae bacterium]